MKKVFNLSVILAVLASALTFTSCGDDDDDAPQILIDVQTVASTAVINITCDEDLTSVALWKGGSKVKDLNLKEGVEKGENKTVFTLVDLEDGDYKVKVACEGNGEGEEVFTIGEGGAAAESFQLTVGGSNSSEGSYISISNKAVYKTTEANANAAAIEIIFDGTTFKSAAESTNSAFEAKASATVSGDAANGWSFETSTGYKGTIKFAGEDKDGKGTYDIDVTRSAK
jgi:hypothetical protein